MRRFLMVLATVLLGNCAFSAGDMPIASSKGKFREKDYETVLMLSQLEAAKEWNGTDPLPISPQKAEEIAEECLIKNVGVLNYYNSTTPTWFALNNSIHRRSGRWYYQIELRPFIAGSNTYPTVTVYVTFDGKCAYPKPVLAKGEK